MTSISQAVSGTYTLISVGRDIYEAIARAMDSAEKEVQSSADKKVWVMAYAKSLILEIGKDWDKWRKYINDFIDAAKSIYNSLKGLF